jgi:hypothetical protein
VKKLTIFVLLAAALLSGCTTRTEFGPCAGAFDEKDPKLTYKLSTWNLVLAVVFFEVIVPPIVVIADETTCPIGRK